MGERALIRRELARQTALLFCVFALLFALMGAGVYSMVSANIYRTADESLRALGTDVAIAAPDGVEAIESPSASAGEIVVEGEEALALSIQRDIVAADPQFVTLMRDAQGALLDTVGLYTSYPAYFAEIPFDANDLDRVFEVEAGGHRYRAMTYEANGPDGPAFLQVLVNVDAEVAILEGFTRALAIYLAAAVVVAAAASYLLSRRTLKPIVASWRAQTEFVQNASHELRTPLAVMQATGELLLDHPEDRIIDRFEDVNTIASETRRLARLVDDLMALSLDDAGRAELDAQKVDVDTLVRDAAATYGDLAEAQGKRIVVDASFGSCIEADPHKLRQLLGILLDNALKYTDADDEVAVRARCAGGKCIVEVADTGCGIDPADRERAFERFYRADKARSRETGGHGLGLSLAKAIVEAHGGSIKLEANEPRGTVAVVTLPASL